MISRSIRKILRIALFLFPVAGDAALASPRIEILIRDNPQLVALDSELSAKLRAALGTPGTDVAKVDQGQRDWLHGRQQCLANSDPTACLAGQYSRRIAEVSAGYGLGPAMPPVWFRCDGDPPLGFKITFYKSGVGSLVAERHGTRVVMVQDPTASGIRYSGDGSEFAEHQGIARIIWPGLPGALRCTSN